MNRSIFKKLLVISALCILLTPVTQCTQQEEQILDFGQQLYTITATIAVAEPEKPVKDLITSLKNDPVAQEIFTKAEEAGIPRHRIFVKAHEIAEITEGEDTPCTKALISACHHDWHYWVDRAKPHAKTAVIIATSVGTLTILGLCARSYARGKSFPVAPPTSTNPLQTATIYPTVQAIAQQGQESRIPVVSITQQAHGTLYQPVSGQQQQAVNSSDQTPKPTQQSGAMSFIIPAYHHSQTNVPAYDPDLDTALDAIIQRHVHNPALRVPSINPNSSPEEVKAFIDYTALLASQQTTVSSGTPMPQIASEALDDDLMTPMAYRPKTPVAYKEKLAAQTAAEEKLIQAHLEAEEKRAVSQYRLLPKPPKQSNTNKKNNDATSNFFQTTQPETIATITIPAPEITPTKDDNVATQAANDHVPEDLTRATIFSRTNQVQPIPAEKPPLPKTSTRLTPAERHAKKQQKKSAETLSLSSSLIVPETTTLSDSGLNQSKNFTRRKKYKPYTPEDETKHLPRALEVPANFTLTLPPIDRQPPLPSTPATGTTPPAAPPLPKAVEKAKTPTPPTQTVRTEVMPKTQTLAKLMAEKISSATTKDQEPVNLSNTLNFENNFEDSSITQKSTVTVSDTASTEPQQKALEKKDQLPATPLMLDTPARTTLPSTPKPVAAKPQRTTTEKEKPVYLFDANGIPIPPAITADLSTITTGNSNNNVTFCINDVFNEDGSLKIALKKPAITPAGNENTSNENYIAEKLRKRNMSLEESSVRDANKKDDWSDEDSE